jgi:pyruvate,orthophosphate dikinase
MVRSAGIVTAMGGVVSHAALIARGWGIAAVCGVDDLVFEPQLAIGGHELREGDSLTIDGGSGRVYLGDCVAPGSEEPEELKTLRRWSVELGIELGDDAPDATEGDVAAPTKASDATADAFAVIRAIALLGVATDERIALSLATSTESVRGVIDTAPSTHLNRTSRGLQLTPEGRGWLRGQLDAERDRTDRSTVDRLYRLFVALDDRFKRLIVNWQVRTVDGRDVINDHTDAAYDLAVREKLCAFHAESMSLMDDICAIAGRLQPYRLRLTRAAAAVSTGDGTMVASPFKDSYHTVWFELHEELMHLSGRTRAAEEAKAAQR